MMDSPLIDLDELVQKCRDERAKSYLAEAVTCYRGGAFRAAIVGTWIAVCFDVIEKLRELALSGDGEAERQVEEVEKTRKSGDIVRALKFEREILVLARDKFELISPLEFVDLERLQADRNRCAHPSLVSDEQAYSPSAELARAHIHAGVTHLLQHPPAQGKYALDRLVREIDSEYFPTDVSLACKAFSSGPLKRPRDSLIRNFTLVVLKRFLQDGISGKSMFRAAAALGAVRAMHSVEFSATLQSKLPSMFRLLEDGDLVRAIVFLERVPDTWQYLKDDVHLRLQAFVQNLPSAHCGDLEFLLGFEPLRAAAEHRVSWASKRDLTGNFYFALPPKIGDRLIVLMLAARSASDADELASSLAQDAMELSADQIRRVVLKSGKNPNVLTCSKLGHFLAAIRRQETIPTEEFDALLEASGLGRYVQEGLKPSEQDDIPF